MWCIHCRKFWFKHENEECFIRGQRLKCPGPVHSALHIGWPTSFPVIALALQRIFNASKSQNSVTRPRICGRQCPKLSHHPTEVKIILSGW